MGLQDCILKVEAVVTSEMSVISLSDYSTSRGQVIVFGVVTGSRAGQPKSICDFIQKSYAISLTFALAGSFHISFCIMGEYFPSGFPTNIPYVCIIIYEAHLILMMLGEEYKLRRCSLYPFSCLLLFPSSKEITIHFTK